MTQMILAWILTIAWLLVIAYVLPHLENGIGWQRRHRRTAGR